MERLRCADRLRLTAFAAETPFDPKEALWNNRLRLLMGRAVLGRPGFNGYSLDEKIPVLPGLSRGGLWRYDDDGRVSYRWPSHPLVKSFLARFPLCGASARGSAAPGDAAMWRWAEASEILHPKFQYGAEEPPLSRDAALAGGHILHE